MTDLSRFHEAQAPVYAAALAELHAGRKQSHWMWFVLPQLRGLGRSERAIFYGLADRAEAAAYLADPILGARLRECVDAVLAHRRKSALEIFGATDALKFHSCLTLFRAVAAWGGAAGAPTDAAPEPAFDAALGAFYAGAPDAETMRLLDAPPLSTVD